MDLAYPHLHAPIRLQQRTMKNRIAFASVFSGRVRGGEVTDELIDFYLNRAEGGAGLIVTEALSAWRGAAPLIQARIFDQPNLDGFSRWADAIHAHETLLLGQIQDPGRGDMRPLRKPMAVSASPLPDDLSWTMPRALRADEIVQMTEDFIVSAAKLQSAGFDGIELSAGHGHIFHQFMSPWMNHRDDDYGGSFENRMRFLDDLLRGLRERCGSAFLLGIRLPGDDGLDGSIGPERAAEIAGWLTARHKLAYINFVQGSHAWTLYRHLPDMHGERAPYAALTAELRNSCNGTAVALTGRITEPAHADRLIADGSADLVMLGRTLIADPAWGLKAFEDRDHDIRKCVSCNNCWHEAVLGRPTACDNNPRVGRKQEADWRPARASAQQRVVVVGSGVAGLEAAWVAAARGHDVTLYGRSPEAGGKLRLFSKLPGCDAISSIFDYQLAAAARARVKIELSWEADAEHVRSLDPGTVVIATGGTMIWPPQLPEEIRALGIVPDLYQAIESLHDHRRRENGTAVIYDHDGTDITYSTAEHLATIFDRVVILCPVECIARDEALVKRQSIYRRMMTKHIHICPWTEPSSEFRLEEARIGWRNVMTGESGFIEEVAFFTYATQRAPNDRLAVALATSGIPVHVIGDAFIPRSIIAATSDGHELGNRI